MTLNAALHVDSGDSDLGTIRVAMVDSTDKNMPQIGSHTDISPLAPCILTS